MSPKIIIATLLGCMAIAVIWLVVSLMRIRR